MFLAAATPRPYSKEQLADIGRETMEQSPRIGWSRASSSGFLRPTTSGIKGGWSASCCSTAFSNEAFGVLWDMGHTARGGRRSRPEQTYQAVVAAHRFIPTSKTPSYDPEHAAAMRDGWRYVRPGAGQLPLAAAIALLKGHGYTAAGSCLEHEKRWHPELEAPEEIFPIFPAWVRPLLG